MPTQRELLAPNPIDYSIFETVSKGLQAATHEVSVKISQAELRVGIKSPRTGRSGEMRDLIVMHFNEDDDESPSLRDCTYYYYPFWKDGTAEPIELKYSPMVDGDTHQATLTNLNDIPLDKIQLLAGQPKTIDWYATAVKYATEIPQTVRDSPLLDPIDPLSEINHPFVSLELLKPKDLHVPTRSFSPLPRPFLNPNIYHTLYIKFPPPAANLPGIRK